MMKTISRTPQIIWITSKKTMNQTVSYFEIHKSKNYSKVVADLLSSAIVRKNFEIKNLSLLIDSLNKLKRYEEAVNIGKKFISEVLENTYALGGFCFSVYMAKFLPHSKDEIVKPETIKTAEWLIEHAKKDPAYFVYLNPLLIAVEYYLERQNFVRAKQLLSDILPEQLKNERAEVMIKGKRIFLKSDKMKFLKLKYDLAKGEKEFEVALSMINHLIEIDPWDIWFKRDKASLLSEMERYDESMNLYEELITRRKEWFLYHETAKLATKMNRNEDALKFFSKAFILGDKQISLYTWHLFIDTAKFLETTGKNEESRWHLDYVFHSAINDEGNKPQEMLKFFHSSGYKPAPDPDLRALRTKMLDFHSKFQFDSEQFEGVISKINERAKSGFVTSDNKKYFFSSRDFKGRIPTEGMTVKFHAETKVSRKTNNEELHAVGLILKE